MKKNVKTGPLDPRARATIPKCSVYVFVFVDVDVCANLHL